MAAIQSAYHRAFLRQRLLRDQYPLTLNALYFRFGRREKVTFSTKSLKTSFVVASRCRTLGSPVA